MSIRFRTFRPLAILLILGGCGVVTPKIQEITDQDIPEISNPPNPDDRRPKITGSAQIEYEVVQRIYCDLRRAVIAANSYAVSEGNSPTGKFHQIQSGLFPRNWGAQVAVSLQVDENSGLSPGITLNRVLPNQLSIFGPGTSGTVTTPQSFALGLGANVTSTATRIDKFNPYWSISDLSKQITPDSNCYSPSNDYFIRNKMTEAPARSSPLIESDLGLQDWLIGAMFVNEIVPSTPQPRGGGGAGAGGAGGGGGGGQKPESISIEIKFIIVTNGNVTPTWKLLRVSANTGSTPLLSTGRTRTHDLIITIGPNTQQTNNSHLASQIGNALTNSIRAPSQ